MQLAPLPVFLSQSVPTTKSTKSPDYHLTIIGSPLDTSRHSLSHWLLPFSDDIWSPEVNAASFREIFNIRTMVCVEQSDDRVHTVARKPEALVTVSQKTLWNIYNLVWRHFLIFSDDFITNLLSRLAVKEFWKLATLQGLERVRSPDVSVKIRRRRWATDLEGNHSHRVPDTRVARGSKFQDPTRPGPRKSWPDPTL